MFFPRMSTTRRNATLGNPMALFTRAMTDTFDAFSTRPQTATPAFNLWADETGAVLTSELPGVSLEAIDITVTGKQVKVASSRKEEAAEGEQRHIRQERPQGQFARTFQMPFAVDAARVEATLANGVLAITLPRAESDKPRKIEVRAE